MAELTASSYKYDLEMAANSSFSGGMSIMCMQQKMGTLDSSYK
jgi:hypothetical protein